MNIFKHLLIILAQTDLVQFSIDCIQKFAHWLRCTVSIATVATCRSVSQKNLTTF